MAGGSWCGSMDSVGPNGPISFSLMYLMLLSQLLPGYSVNKIK